MFRAVRDSLATNWDRVRSKGLLGLFAFEFTVVVLGVLAAQALQTWSRERELHAETLAAKTRLERGFGDARIVIEVWKAAMPCLRTRVADVMRIAGSGGTLEPGVANRPYFAASNDYSETPEIYARLAEVAGDELTQSLGEMPSRIESIHSMSRDIAARWEVFQLLDPEFGPVSADDRAAARLAGAEILSRFRSIDAALLRMRQMAERHPIAVTTPFDRQTHILPVRSCAELWANGTAYRKLDPGEAPPS